MDSGIGIGSDIAQLYAAFNRLSEMNRATIDSVPQNNRGGNMMNIDPQLAPVFSPMPNPFYPPYYTLLEPYILPSSYQKGKKLNAQMSIAFTISAEQLNSLSTDENVFPRHEVQIRFFNITKSDEDMYPDELPRNCIISVNNVAQNAESGRPVNITAYLKNNQRAKKYTVKINWIADDRTFAFGICLVARVRAAMLQRIVERESILHLPYERTEETIKRRLNGGEDDDVTMDSLKISLLCPLTKTRMNIAIRSIECTHLQCFDLESFLQMNEVRPKWQCCVCNKRATYDKIRIDKYFSALLNNLDRAVTDVELLKDGTYRGIREGEIEPTKKNPVKSEISRVPSTSTSALPVQQREPDDVITLSDDDDDEEPSSTINNSTVSTASSSSSSSFLHTPSKQESAIITISSEDESLNSTLNSATSSSSSSSTSLSPSPPVSSPAVSSSSSTLPVKYMRGRSSSTFSSVSTVPSSVSSTVSSACRDWGATPVRRVVKRVPETEPEVITISDDEEEKTVAPRRSKRLRSDSTSLDAATAVTTRRKVSRISKVE